MRIGLFAGTFNPIHNGHLIIAETALSQFNLDKIYFLPSGNPPHKESNLIHKNHRYQMTLLAIQDNARFFISPLEMSPKFKFSYQTISFFAQKYKNDELFFILGLDAFLEIKNWKKGLNLLNMCKFIVMSRFEKTSLKLKSEFKKYAQNLFFVNDLDVNISSTLIRERIKNNLSIKYLTPEIVKNYIYENELYK